MRKLSDGLKMGAAMEEALSRMERGEDPDKVEAEMGDLLEGEDPFVINREEKRERGRPTPAARLTTLYEL